MTKNEVKKGLMVLSIAGLINAPDLSRKEVAEYLITLWHKFLGEYSYQQFEVAIMLYIKSNRYFPTVSEVLKEVPIPDKYLTPGVAFNKFMTEKLDLDIISHRLIIEAVADCGYAKYYLNQLDPKTKEIQVRPKIERRYKELVELEEKRENYRLVVKDQKLLEEK